MLAELKELWRFRELLVSMVQRELKIRYKNSVFGFLWSIITPLVTAFVMYIVFGHFLRLSQNVHNYGAYILAAYLPFVCFQGSLLDSAQSVLAALPTVKKIYFPREILPLAAIISNFIHLLMAMLVFFAFLLGVYVLDPRANPFQWTTIYLPFLMLIQLALSAGLGLLVSALNTFYEDVKYIVTVVLYLMVYLCPIMYFTEMVANSDSNVHSKGLVYNLYNLNPMAVLCTAYRKTLLAREQITINGKQVDMMPLNWTHVGLAALTSCVTLWFGYYVFNRMKWRFVERP